MLTGEEEDEFINMSIELTQTGMTTSSLIHLNVSGGGAGMTLSNDPDRLDLYTCRFENSVGRAEKTISILTLTQEMPTSSSSDIQITSADPLPAV